MVNFEVNHKVASFKEVCLGVVMVLGDKAQTYPPPPPKKKNWSPVGDIWDVCPGIGNFI